MNGKSKIVQQSKGEQPHKEWVLLVVVDHSPHFLLKMAICTGKFRIFFWLNVSFTFFSTKLLIVPSISDTSLNAFTISGSNSIRLKGEFCYHYTTNSQPVSDPNCSSLSQRWKFYLQTGTCLPIDCRASLGRLQKLLLLLSPQMLMPSRQPYSDTSRRLVIILRGSGVLCRTKLAMILSNLWTVLKDDSPSWTPISRRCLSCHLSMLSVTPSLWMQEPRKKRADSTIFSLRSVARQVQSSGLMPMVQGMSLPVPQPTSQMWRALLSLSMLTRVQQKVSMTESQLLQVGARPFHRVFSWSMVQGLGSFCIRYVIKLIIIPKLDYAFNLPLLQPHPRLKIHKNSLKPRVLCLFTVLVVYVLLLFIQFFHIFIVFGFGNC